MATKVTGSQIIAKAKTFLGQNGTYFWKLFNCPSGWAWCCIFVWSIFKLCDASNLFCGGGKVAGCGLEKEWCDKNLQKVSLKNAREGDIVIFSWRAGEISHTGFAIKPLSSTVLQTIEGNTSGGIVAIRQRDVSTILGIYRPKYATESTTSNRTRGKVSSATGVRVHSAPSMKKKTGNVIKGGSIIYCYAVQFAEGYEWWKISASEDKWVRRTSLKPITYGAVPRRYATGVAQDSGVRIYSTVSSLNPTSNIIKGGYLVNCFGSRQAEGYEWWKVDTFGNQWVRKTSLKDRKSV